MVRYQRVLVKLSGGAFAGNAGFGIDQGAVDLLADEILALTRLGVQVAVMVGGGNIFRGRLAQEWGIERAEADNIGMMATVINSLFLRGALAARGAGEVRVMTAVPMQAIAEPYIRLRAIHNLEKGYIVIFAAGIGQPYVTTDYPAVQRALEIRAEVLLAAKQGVPGIFTADPRLEPNARRFRTIGYDEALARGLQVMDQGAFILARDQQLPLHVFDAAQRGAMTAICQGADVGSYIGPGAPTTFD
ncbi:MAG TPA: UMP kinase [Chloroflexota bacterium]|jgi:uridylate kinase|nr:UMP kinase [Chloroflexota bacterium]